VPAADAADLSRGPLALLADLFGEKLARIQASYAQADEGIGGTMRCLEGTASSETLLLAQARTRTAPSRTERTNARTKGRNAERAVEADARRRATAV
jgi:hypothetical protein